MALQAGNQNATSGMSKAIYDELRAVLEPGLGELGPDALNEIRASWQKMAYAISRGVIQHIQSNMEVRGVQTRGNVTATVSGGTATATNVTFTQSNDGTGRVT